MEGIIPLPEIDNLAKRVIQANPKAKDLAISITGNNHNYNKNETEQIILPFLKRNKYSDDSVDKIIELHPDKKFFDIYFARKNSIKKPQLNLVEEENSKLNCAACATFSAEGGGDEPTKESNPFSKQKALMVTAGILLFGTLIYSSLDTRTT